MIRPTLEEARRYRDEYTVVPIGLELFSDVTTPIEVLKRLKARSKSCYLLESVEGGEKWGRYSFLGFEPELTVTCADGDVRVSGGKPRAAGVGPNEVLREILAEYRSPALPFFPSFTGGFVGYMSYDYAKYSEKKLWFTNANDAGFDDMRLMLFGKIIAFDHLRQKIVIIVNVKTDDLEENYVNGALMLKEIEQIIKSGRAEGGRAAGLAGEFTPLFTREQYCGMVARAKEYIAEGDVFQAVLSNRLEAEYEGDLLNAYRVLRTINPSPYMVYIDFGDVQVAGASPETLLALRDGRLHTFPIAGTCPRGKTEEEDERLIAALLSNEKELAEHNMLVDLSRNDLGKISAFGTVNVESYKQIQKFSHVSHIASAVSGALRPGADQLDALAAVMPTGTLSGAPKIRAMEIINELEGVKRGVYGGAIGHIDFTGNMDMCIAIRMAVKTGGKVYVSSGAGVVADSAPEKEYEECANKARAMLVALERAREVE